MAKGSLRVNGIIVDTDGEIKASTGDSIVIREDDGSAVITVDTNGKTSIGGAMDDGVNDTGYDVKFFGATSGAYLEWDESAMELEIRGPAAGHGKLLLSTAEQTNVDGDKLGQIDFQAPIDSAGLDAVSPGASIWAEVDATFSTTVNATELVFATAESENAVEKMRITSDGKVGIGTTAPSSHLVVDGAGTSWRGQFMIKDATTGNNADPYMTFWSGSETGSGDTGLLGQIGFQSSSDNKMQVNNYTGGDLILQGGGQGGNVGIGVTPKAAWRSTCLGVQFGTSSALWQSGGDNTLFSQNVYEHTDTSRKYIITGEASYYYQYNGGHFWETFASGTADASLATASGVMAMVESGKVGIGTAAPDSHLHIYRGSAGSVTANSGAALTIEDDATAYIQFLLPESTEGGLIFGQGTDNNVGGIFYSNTNDSIYMGTNNAGTSFNIGSGGDITMPQQPIFYQQVGTGMTNIGHGAWHTVTFGTDAVDQGSHFASNTFTAPVDGNYYFHLEIQFGGLAQNATYYHTGVVTNGPQGAFYTTSSGSAFGASNPTYSRVVNTVICHLDAGDTAYAAVYQSTGGTNNTTDVDGGSRFYGFLVG